MTPHWSPDGKFLAYQVRGDEEGLAIRSVETGEVRRARSNRYVPDPRWSPDGQSIIANSADATGRLGIMRIDVPSGKASLIVHTEGGGARPRWSPDGAKIYYVSRPPFGAEWRMRERDIRTGVEREIFRHAQLEDFEISPDGRYVAVRTRLDATSQTSSVSLVPVSGGEPRELVRLPLIIQDLPPWSQMAWTPDGRALLAATRSAEGVELRLIEIDSGISRKLDIDVSEWTVAESGPAGGFSLSPDGKSIAFLMGKSEAQVWAMENFLK